MRVGKSSCLGLEYLFLPQSRLEIVPKNTQWCHPYRSEKKNNPPAIPRQKHPVVSHIHRNVDMTHINVNVISGPQTADILFQGPCCEK